MVCVDGACQIGILRACSGLELCHALSTVEVSSKRLETLCRALLQFECASVTRLVVKDMQRAV